MNNEIILEPRYKFAAFIRLNTPEIRERLEKLGYISSEIYPEGNSIATSPTSRCPCYTILDSSLYDEPNKYITWNCHGRVDCEENIELFFSIVQYSELTDKDQWFVTHDLSRWEKSNEDTSPLRKKPKEWHRATPKEIVEHFITE